MKTIDLDPALRTDPRFGRQRFSAKAAYIEMYMYAASTENWGMFSATIEDIAWILGRSNEIDLMQKDIDALVGTGLLIAHQDGSIEIAGFRETQQRIIDNRDYYKRLQANRRAKQPVNSDTPVTPDEQIEDTVISNPDVTCNTNISNTDVNCITKPNLTKPNKEVFAQSANPPQQKQKTKTQREQNPRGNLFVAVASLCKIPTDDKRSARAINAAAEWLLNKGQTPERLEDFLTWWNTNDWRGKKGDPPKPNEIVTEWLKFEAGPKQQPTNGSKPIAQMPKNKMMLNGVEVYI